VDGLIGEPLLVVLDLPDSTVRLTLVDALGQEILANALGSPVSSERWIWSIPADMVRVPGLWRATVVGDLTRLVFDLMIGTVSPLALPLWDVVLGIASHYAEVVEGHVEEAGADWIRDSRLGIGADYSRGRFVVFHPEDSMELGFVGRSVIQAGSDGTLTVAGAFPAVPRVGGRFALLPVPVSEVLRTLRIAVAEYGRLVRQQLVARDLEVSDGFVTVPRGATHVVAVWSEGERIADSDWKTVPGRKVFVGDLETVTLQLLFPLVVPSQPLGYIDSEVTSLLAHAGMHLHSARARGAGLDVDEHLRRMVALGQLAEAQLPRLAGRVPHGAREVIQ